MKQRFVVATYNTEWFFNAAPAMIPDLALAPLGEKARRLAHGIAALSEAPHVLALQEVGGVEEVDALRAELERVGGWKYAGTVGRFASARTGQRVALLWREGAVEVRSVGSFDLRKEEGWETEEEEEPLPAGVDRGQLLEKNVYLECDVLGVPTLFVNVHLKAYYDKDATAIRKHEVEVLRHFVDKRRKAGQALCLLGDFNDFDCSVVCAKEPPIRSGVLEKVRKCWSLDTALEHVQPVQSRMSTVYGDMIDHILVDTTKGFEIWRAEVYLRGGDTAQMTGPERTSDHFPLACWLQRRT